MELPQKIKQPEERMMNGTIVVTHLSPTELKINELIEYLESQKEGEGCEYGEPQKDCKCDYCSKAYKEEPKQIDVNIEALLSDYHYCKQSRLESVDSGKVKRYGERMDEILSIFKQALQQ